jgi:Flagellar hook-associated protein
LPRLGCNNTPFELSGSVIEPVDSRAEISVLRDSVFELNFIAQDVVEIRDVDTDTLMATRRLDEAQQLNYRGIEVTFDPLPKAGDRFVIDGNNTGPDGEFNANANNANIVRVVALEFDSNAFGTGETIGESYRQLFALAGNRANQASVARDALEVVKEQAVSARDDVSGVSLDEEAADLIRFQQAYQASAQVIQAAQTLFDRIISIR